MNLGIDGHKLFQCCGGFDCLYFGHQGILQSLVCFCLKGVIFFICRNKLLCCRHAFRVGCYAGVFVSCTHHDAAFGIHCREVIFLYVLIEYRIGDVSLVKHEASRAIVHLVHGNFCSSSNGKFQSAFVHEVYIIKVSTASGFCDEWTVLCLVIYVRIGYNEDVLQIGGSSHVTDKASHISSCSAQCGFDDDVLISTCLFVPTGEYTVVACAGIVGVEVGADGDVLCGGTIILAKENATPSLVSLYIAFQREVFDDRTVYGISYETGGFCSREVKVHGNGVSVSVEHGSVSI